MTPSSSVPLWCRLAHCQHANTLTNTVLTQEPHQEQKQQVGSTFLHSGLTFPGSDQFEFQMMKHIWRPKRGPL